MKRRLLVALGVVAVGLAGFSGFRLLRTMAFFRIRRVELVGAHYLTAPEVARALAIPRGQSIFDGTGALLARVRVLPGVAEAHLGRRLALDSAQTVVLVLSTASSGLGTSGTFQPSRPTPVSSSNPIYDPLVAKFSVIARSLLPEELGKGETDDAELAQELGLARRGNDLYGFGPMWRSKWRPGESSSVPQRQVTTSATCPSWRISLRDRGGDGGSSTGDFCRT